ncbi:MAG: Na+/H+ antiporter NhaC [Saprospiraceae bacterium]|nr:Na+/H+ antiporter NhaC [Saprospiraceae bacterium]MDW8485052.1 Na+/H+ antiporter NhaC [Saprospiraceae bacterium]
MRDIRLVRNKELSIGEALLPVLVLIALLAYNVLIFGGDSLNGSNQFILLMGAAVAALVGFRRGVSYRQMIGEVADNLKSTTEAILILLLVGALAGTWMLSGIIPMLIYGGVQLINPKVFLPVTVLVCSIISVATGSSWTTSATVGIALIGIGKALGIPEGMVAGAVISGAYFGDKMSPLSDTTNLASAMAGSDLFEHIRYMTLTTVPTYLLTLTAFVIIGFYYQPVGIASPTEIMRAIESTFYVTPWLLLVPAAVIGLIILRKPPLVALLAGTLLGGLFALIFQPALVTKLAGANSLHFEAAYRGVVNAMTISTNIETTHAELNDLFATKGMAGMLPTVWLVICAMAFGGIMEAIGALACISAALLRLAHSVFGLFASTVASCLALNATASDQYLAIVIPGKMFSKAYAKRGLAPVNLSRTLEDAGTVTSVLVPWNTCGAYNARVLGVETWQYLPYAVFNYVSPFMTLLFAALQLKIKRLKEEAPVAVAEKI